jgi:hypothetical protein
MILPASREHDGTHRGRCEQTAARPCRGALDGRSPAVSLALGGHRGRTSSPLFGQIRHVPRLSVEQTS